MAWTDNLILTVEAIFLKLNWHKPAAGINSGLDVFVFIEL